MLITGAGLREEFYHLHRIVGSIQDQNDWQNNHSLFAFLWLNKKIMRFLQQMTRCFGEIKLNLLIGSEVRCNLVNTKPNGRITYPLRMA